MDLQLNREPAQIMHIDLNSCFAMLEQQANPLIRHKPVAVAAYATPGGIILAASYEAKALGITVGQRVRDARTICPQLIVMTPDPDKYIDAHHRFKKVLLAYTNRVTPKSIDEFVLDLHDASLIRSDSLETIGRHIKRDISRMLGEYVTVNIGIAPNRFLAKLAAGLHKPDGMDVINHANLADIYAGLSLTSLPGINDRYAARLRLAGINTPLQLLAAPAGQLQREVFHSITGYYWYLRLRGYEIDAVNFRRQSFGQQYALGKKTADRLELSRLLLKLCVKAGRRLRRNNYEARGVHLSLTFANSGFWTGRNLTPSAIYSDQEIFHYADKLLLEAVIPAPVRQIAVTLYHLSPVNPVQLNLLDKLYADSKAIAQATDAINDRYGEYTVVPAMMSGMDDVIIKRIAFGGL